MTRRVAPLAFAVLAACSSPVQDAETFARSPQTAARAVADCDAGLRTRDCIAARQGLAEARRQMRMAAYAQTIREP
ncbi:hypothetical protein CQ035_00835 [Brevundimonas sp. MYb46]|nr:hypothetical protein CQ026_15195 [Brevundimonas sp. MYb31]PRA27665.1 hypothetical protein CQ024_11300 [Brevundimonas sp. MYb27]PRB17617.1 hypothetical protein CQ039_00835 [Brevundimonas sp. MYb52]PRB37989.1 hypothetical protein CQ035_00835 [Brevundimonas sp. MYb46]PRB45381.1 hypothetical protein CQ028_13150 [Brevundimonas sp. MYb33]